MSDAAFERPDVNSSANGAASRLLGLELGDAMVLRNSGGRVTNEVIEDPALISEPAERRFPNGPFMEIAVIHHTECGARMLADDEFRASYVARIHADDATLIGRAVLDPAQTVARDVDLLCASSALSPRPSFSGHVYDVATGLVSAIVEPARGMATTIEAP